MKLKKLVSGILIASPIIFLHYAHADDSPKEASATTKSLNNQLITELPFNNKESFVNAEKGFIAPLPDHGVIKNSNGDIVWDLSNFSFIKKDSPSPDTVNPSLWRQSQLVSMGGLFKVNEQIYQVRTADLSNITFIDNF